MKPTIRVSLYTALLIATLPVLVLATPEPNKGAYQKSLELNEKGALALQNHETERALELFQQSYNIDQSNITAAYNLAGAFAALHREEEGIKLLTPIVKTYSKDAGLFTRLGDLHFSNKNIDAAQLNYERAMKIENGYPGVAAKLGVIYTMKNKYKDAEKMLTKAVAETPDDAKTLANYASILLMNKKPEESIRAAKKSLQGKVEAGTYVTLGQAYELSKDPANAVIAYEKAKALGDSRPELAERLSALKKANS